MRSPSAHAVLVFSLTLAACAKPQPQPEPAGPASLVHSFDAATAGALPAGWRAQSTRPDGPTATWSVVAIEGAPSAPHALALTAPNHVSEGTFNLCWTAEPRFQDGVIDVALHSIAGEADQGGGPAWRIQGADDYYVCRYNPLEKNFRVYVVSKGQRRQLASASTLARDGAWSTIRVEHRGTQITCSLDGEALLTADDATIASSGGVGVWTKADACTAFDDLTVRAR